ncbi:MAG: hypothetical protein M1281_18005 [Chloroflexi bacterium]|nr:hypothetical protein [Chloroflexota bacterium]
MAIPIQLIPLLCCKCQTPVLAQPDETAWVCEQCGQGLLLSETEGTVPLDVHFGVGIAPNVKGRPFWVAAGTVQLQRRIYGSGDQSPVAQKFWASGRTFFIPAFSLPLADLVDGGVKMLLQPPTLAPGGEAAFLPVTLHREDVNAYAEFIVMGIEAARKDNLKELQFTLTLETPALWILP